MSRKLVLVMSLTLVLMGILSIAVKVQWVEASGTIYIRANGSVEGTDKIQRDGNVYTFTGNVNDEIVVERDNIVVDGAGYTLQGTGSGTGINMTDRSNVTIKYTKINSFDSGILISHASDIWIWNNNITDNSFGILLSWSSDNSVSSNTITNNDWGIWLSDSSDNSVYGNTITKNEDGVWLWYSSTNRFWENNIANNKRNLWIVGKTVSDYINNVDVSNTVDGKPIYYWVSKRDLDVPLDAGYVALVNCTRIIVQNLNLTNNWHGILLAYTTNSTITNSNITNNQWGIELWASSNNIIYGNNITKNNAGVFLYSSSNNTFYHNNFVDNERHVFPSSDNSTNVWDDGYPSGGNYWSDYYGVDRNDDGIGDIPYEIDEKNQDNYPLKNPWSPPWSPTSAEEEIPFWMQWWFWAITVAGIVVLAVILLLRMRGKKPFKPAVERVTSEALRDNETERET